MLTGDLLWTDISLALQPQFSSVQLPSRVLSLEKLVCRSGSNSQNWTWNNRLVPNWERSTSRLYIVALLATTSPNIFHWQFPLEFPLFLLLDFAHCLPSAWMVFQHWCAYKVFSLLLRLLSSSSSLTNLSLTHIGRLRCCLCSYCTTNTDLEGRSVYVYIYICIIDITSAFDTVLPEYILI